MIGPAGNPFPVLSGVDVIPVEWAEKGCPRLIPDPRPLAFVGPRAKKPDRPLVLVAHPDDVEQIKELAGQAACPEG